MDVLGCSVDDSVRIFSLLLHPRNLNSRHCHGANEADVGEGGGRGECCTAMGGGPSKTEAGARAAVTVEATMKTLETVLMHMHIIVVMSWFREYKHQWVA